MKIFFLLLSFLTAAILSTNSIAQPGIITTVAGTGVTGFSGDGGPAIAAILNGPGGIAIDGDGNIYIADYGNNRIRMITASTGLISTIAGTGAGGFSGDGGYAINATLFNPSAIALDANGNIYFTEFSNHRVRMINRTTWKIYTVAGSGTAGYSGDHGQATNAKLNYPQGLTFDTAGNLFVADFDNNRIRKINMSTGIITTVAGSGIAGYSGDGGPASAAKLQQPSAVAFDGSGNLYIAEFRNSTVRKVSSADNTITTIAGTGTGGYSGDGGPGTAAQLDQPLGMAVGPDGTVYIGDWYHNNRLRMLDPSTGNISTIAGTGTSGYAGDGGPATDALISGVDGITLDATGNIYFSDEFNSAVRKISCGNCFPASVPVVIGTLITEIYPNPVTTELTISASDKINDVTITNLLGEAVYDHQFDTKQVQVNVADLTSGIYFVRVNHAAVRKFIKQ